MNLRDKYISKMRNELSMMTDDATADYFISESMRIASIIFADDDAMIDDDTIDDYMNELIEPACTFSPLPASFDDFNEQSIIAFADLAFRSLIYHMLYA